MKMALLFTLLRNGGGKDGGDFHAPLCPFQGMRVRAESSVLVCRGLKQERAHLPEEFWPGYLKESRLKSQ